MSFPRYPAYKPSGVEWLGEVPEHWLVEPFKRQIERNDGGSWGDDPEGLMDTIVLRSTEQTVDGRWKIEDPSFRKLNDHDKNSSLLVEGDLLLTKSSGSSLHIGKTTLVDKQIENLQCCFSNFMQRIRLKSTVLPRLGWYILNNRISRFQLDFLSNTTTGLANLNATIIGQIIIPNPPGHEQQAIISFLDHETAKIDALIAEQQRLIELLQEKRQAVISHAVTKGLNPDAPMKDSGEEWLGEVPEHWDIAAVGHRYSVQLGKMLDANQQTGNHSKPYLRVADVQWGEINTEDLPEMDFPPEAEARYRLKAGDLLVNEGGSYVGRSAIWSAPLGECYYQKALHRLRAYDATKDSPHFMYFLMEHATRLGVFIAGGNQTTIDHLTAEQLRRYRFAFPPMQEQKHIASYLRLKTDSLQQLTTQAESMVGVLIERRSALVSAAVTGQIDVRGLAPEASEH